MVRSERRRLFGLLLPIALVGVSLFSTEAFAQKAKETIVHSPPTLRVLADPVVMTVCEDQMSAPVHLNASAASPGGMPIRYAWRVTAGRIQGDGANVTWDLSGVRPGYYSAHVDTYTGSDNELCQAFSTTTVLVNRCAPINPVCPTIAISCPDNPVLGQPVDFNATVAGGTPAISPIYNWTVSAGTIISGQGTSSIRVDSTGLAGQSVRATLTMGGPLDCSQTCIVHFPVPIECRKFDEFPDIARNDEKARLDNFAIELQHDPTSTAYAIVYPGHQGRPGDVNKHTTRIVDYLVNSRGLDSRRIVTLVGPARPELLVELWSCPQGGKPPTPIR
jgi:PKD-like domain